MLARHHTAWTAAAVVVALTVPASVPRAQEVELGPPLSPRNANYTIDVTLDAEEKTLRARQVIEWRNIDDQPADDLWLHLYLNAFSNDRSTFWRESEGRHRSFTATREPDDWGWVRMSSARLEDGTELIDTLEYRQPDDGNVDDRTVARLTLPRPVAPGETLRLEVDFEARLPRVTARTGWSEEFFMVGQWFPKLGVFRDGEWSCHQFHLNSEFFSDYGVYDVSITVPADHVVGASGARASEADNGDGTRTVRYIAEDVHDFAWTASPRFEVFEDQWEHVRLRFLCQPEHVDQVDRHLQAAKNALEWYGRYGPYPYPVLTLVDPGTGGGGAGGMEYPTLFTTGTHFLVPEGLRAPELVTIHEFGHQYFYGILGSNEFLHAWLDEGINSYAEMGAVDHYYGGAVTLGGLHFTNRQVSRASYVGVSRRAQIGQRAWEHYPGLYGSMSYSKPALMLGTLEGYLGEEAMLRVLRTYYDRWKFRHPTPEDFIAVAEEVAGEDLDWFFAPNLYGSDELDYGIGRVSAKRVRERSGAFLEDGRVATYRSGELVRLDGEEVEPDDEDADDGRSDDGDDDEDTEYVSKVLVRRYGEIVFPVEIAVGFDDGSVVREQWDGRERFLELEYVDTRRVDWAEVDPDGRVLLDVELLNNGRLREPKRGASLQMAANFMVWFQSWLHLLGGL